MSRISTLNNTREDQPNSRYSLKIEYFFRCQYIFIAGLTTTCCYAKFHYRQRSSAVEQRTHKPLVTGSNPVAATSKPLSSLIDQGTTKNPQAYLYAIDEQGITLKQATFPIY